MSGIRVTYSGLISFVTGLVSIFTGLVFVLIVARTLTAEEYGALRLINSLILYVIVIQPIISYWSTRETARGIGSGKTAVLSGGIFSIIGVFLYIVIAYFVSPQTKVDQNILFFAGILVPVTFLNSILTAINLGWKPQATSYAALSLEVIKLPMALIFVYFFHMGITGVILASAIATLTSIAILIIYARDKIKNKFRKEFLKNWLRLSWLALYPGIASFIFSLDVLIFSTIMGSVIGLAFWAAAWSIANLTSNAGLITGSAYSKLLEGGKNEYLQENLTRLFYFAIPLAALSITFARPALFALNPIYEVAAPVVIFITIRTLLFTLNNTFRQYLRGIEKVDIDKESKFSNYIKSKLFFVPTIQLIQYSAYVASLAVVLLLLGPNSRTLDLVTYWSIILLLTEIPSIIYFYKLVRKNFTLRLDLGSIFKYLLISVMSFGMTYVLTEQFLEYKNNIFEFLPNLLFFMGVGIGSYLVITYLVDLRTRKLFKAIIQEIKNKEY